MSVKNWVLPEINLLLCNQCGTCIERCPAGALEMEPEGPFIARPFDCSYCALCDAVCPREAITCTYEIVWGAKDR
ncbi:MAG: 4Fe-4S binding protein [Anaerolineae bacterium]|jgi:MinD superfamily P-loop ATPase